MRKAHHRRFVEIWDEYAAERDYWGFWFEMARGIIL
jgi:hypothetical protein